MKSSFMSKLMSWFSIKKILIVALIILVALGAFYLLKVNQGSSSSTVLLVRTINKLQKDIQGFQVQQSQKKNNSEIKGKIDPNLIKEFRDDEQFLQKIIRLKKEKMLAQLAIEVESLKRKRKKANAAGLVPVQQAELPKKPSAPPPPPRPKMELAIANEANQSAVVIVDGGNPITLRVGNVIANYKLINVTRNYIQVQDLTNNRIESIYLKQGGVR